VNDGTYKKSSKSHLPGAKKWYPKSGSEEVFWDRCEEATILRGRELTFREIGERLNIDVSMAHQMVRRYLRAAARFYPAIEQRELIATKYRELLRLVYREMDRLEDSNDNIDKRLACILRAESLIAKEAQLYGHGPGIEVHIGGQKEDGSFSLNLALEDQRKLRAKARELRAIADGSAVDAEHTVEGEAKIEGNGEPEGQRGSSSS